MYWDEPASARDNYDRSTIFSKNRTRPVNTKAPCLLHIFIGFSMNHTIWVPPLLFSALSYFWPDVQKSLAQRNKGNK